jgi:hypothetical protein
MVESIHLEVRHRSEAEHAVTSILGGGCRRCDAVGGMTTSTSGTSHKISFDVLGGSALLDDGAHRGDGKREL